MKYIVVSYNNDTKEVINRTIDATSKAVALIEFKQVENYLGYEVLLNVIEAE